MNRKWLSTATAASLAIALAGYSAAGATTEPPGTEPAGTEAAGTEAAGTEAAGTEAPAASFPAEIATDIGVTEDTITIGMLADQSGIFSPLVNEIVAAQQVYWDAVNRDGGIAGRQVELLIEDNAYDVPTHLEKYEILRDQVAIISQSTGSPHTAAIAQTAGRGRPRGDPAVVVLRLAGPRVRPERVRGLHDVLRRVDERHRVAAQQPGRADRRARSRSRASTAVTAMREPAWPPRRSAWRSCTTAPAK